jgi:hypothetical protein
MLCGPDRPLEPVPAGVMALLDHRRERRTEPRGSTLGDRVRVPG